MIVFLADLITIQKVLRSKLTNEEIGSNLEKKEKEMDPGKIKKCELGVTNLHRPQL